MIDNTATQLSWIWVIREGIKYNETIASRSIERDLLLVSLSVDPLLSTISV